MDGTLKKVVDCAEELMDCAKSAERSGTGDAATKAGVLDLDEEDMVHEINEMGEAIESGFVSNL